MKTTSYLPLLALSAFAAAQAVTNSTDTSSKSVIFTDLDSVVSLFNPECSRPCIRDSFLGYFGTDKYFVDPKCVITGVKGEKFDGFTTCLCNGSPAVKNTTEAVTLAKEVDDKYTACLEKVQSDGACDVSSLASEDFDAATRGRIEQSCKATLEAAGKETDSKDTPKNDPKNKGTPPRLSPLLYKRSPFPTYTNHHSQRRRQPNHHHRRRRRHKIKRSKIQPFRHRRTQSCRLGCKDPPRRNR